MSFRSRISSSTAFVRTSFGAWKRYGFGTGGGVGVFPLPKSMPRPTPVSLLLPLTPACRLLPLSRIRSFDWSTPFSCCAAAAVQTIRIIKKAITGFITKPLPVGRHLKKGDGVRIKQRINKFKMSREKFQVPSSRFQAQGRLTLNIELGTWNFFKATAKARLM